MSGQEFYDRFEKELNTGEHFLDFPLPVHLDTSVQIVKDGALRAARRATGLLK